MRISDLSRLSGVPITTIKYYLREGLLPPGTPTAHNQAVYDDDHLRRLRLIRALVSVRGLSVNATAELLEALSRDDGDLHRTLGLVLGALPVGEHPAGDQPAGDTVPRARLEEAEKLIEALGWRIHRRSEGRLALARALYEMAEVGLPLRVETLVPYARLTERIAALDLDQLAGDEDDHIDIAERAVLTTILLEPVLLLLRRMAQENESASRHGTGEEPR
ncbi:MerR family transcriptional regulator [Streptomyces alkaliphilus]|uniref:MerR family transcriptional regulator n=1 Tax=Streptomyces alkaliphilus TaxID=1472722 RepID=A0A7W3Y1Y3_9ACTN|nr:MerR family transcriptional regulator [Streptomyces alkaliphilus]MBB0244978.1 MerR family transcriptional regulator [Streptomyces alkaliphilus]